MTISYLKQKMNLVNKKNMGASHKLISSTITLKDGTVQTRHNISKIDFVYREIILCINEILKGTPFIKEVKSIVYQNRHNKDQIYVVDFENFAINGEPIDPEQLVPNNKVTHIGIRTDLYFGLFDYPLSVRSR